MTLFQELFYSKIQFFGDYFHFHQRTFLTIYSATIMFNVMKNRLSKEEGISHVNIFESLIKVSGVPTNMRMMIKIFFNDEGGVIRTSV